MKLKRHIISQEHHSSCSSRGPEFIYQHTQITSKSSISPVPRVPSGFFTSSKTRMHVAHRHSYRKKTLAISILKIYTYIEIMKMLNILFLRNVCTSISVLCQIFSSLSEFLTLKLLRYPLLNHGQFMLEDKVVCLFTSTLSVAPYPILRVVPSAAAEYQLHPLFTLTIILVVPRDHPLLTSFPTPFPVFQPPTPACISYDCTSQAG